MKSLEMRGLYPATATPFATDGDIDFDALRVHLETTAAAEGTAGLVVNGHAGEIAALTSEERERVIGVGVGAKRPNQLLVAGVEAHTIRGAVDEGLRAKQAGADAILVLPPFDIRPYRMLSQFEGPVLQFFETMDREVDLPMVIFEYADKSGCSYPVETLVRLAELDNVVAVKAATGTVTRYTDVWDALQDRVAVLAACDAPELLGMLLYGGHGALIGISVIGTEHWAEMVDAALGGRAEQARTVFNGTCIPLMRALFWNQEPPGPVQFVSTVKEALRLMGQIPCARVRPFVVDLGEEEKRRVAQGLAEAGLLHAALV